MIRKVLILLVLMITGGLYFCIERSTGDFADFDKRVKVSAGKIEFDIVAEIFDVPLSDKKRRFVFELTNDLDEALEFDLAAVSCRCLSIEPPAFSLPPSKATCLKVAMDIRDGPFNVKNGLVFTVKGDGIDSTFEVLIDGFGYPRFWCEPMAKPLLSLPEDELAFIGRVWVATEDESHVQFKMAPEAVEHDGCQLAQIKLRENGVFRRGRISAKRYDVFLDPTTSGNAPPKQFPFSGWVGLRHAGMHRKLDFIVQGSSLFDVMPTSFVCSSGTTVAVSLRSDRTFRISGAELAGIPFGFETEQITPNYARLSLSIGEGAQHFKGAGLGLQKTELVIDTSIGIVVVPGILWSR